MNLFCELFFLSFWRNKIWVKSCKKIEMFTKTTKAISKNSKFSKRQKKIVEWHKIPTFPANLVLADSVGSRWGKHYLVASFSSPLPNGLDIFTCPKLITRYKENRSVELLGDTLPPIASVRELCYIK